MSDEIREFLQIVIQEEKDAKDAFDAMDALVSLAEKAKELLANG